MGVEMSESDNQFSHKDVMHRYGKRYSRIDQLFETEAGQQQLSEMLLAIECGAYCHVAARTIGISPNTFSQWLTRGRNEAGSLYAKFRDMVESAISLARVDAEMEVKRSNPLKYLKQGPGRMLGDQWNDNLTALPNAHHNLDGTVSNTPIENTVCLTDETTEEEQQLIEHDKQNDIDNTLTNDNILQALKILKDSGQELTTDQLISMLEKR